jgi:hypothetical protein
MFAPERSRQGRIRPTISVPADGKPTLRGSHFLHLESKAAGVETERKGMDPGNFSVIGFSVVYKGLYPGIDLRIYGVEKEMEAWIAA